MKSQRKSRESVVEPASGTLILRSREELIPWAEDLKMALFNLGIKEIEPYRRTGELWLQYLYSLETIPIGIQGLLSTKHFYGNTGTFRGFLQEFYRTRKTKQGVQENANLRRMERILDVLITLKDLKIRNPLSAAKALFPEASKSSRTVRSAIEPAMVDTIIEFNARNDFAFSKSNNKHYRFVRNPETGVFEDVWFPGYGVLLDLLLRLPLRSFDARWMDSSDGDELIYDRDARSMTDNPSPLARRGRREGFIQSMSTPFRSRKQILGVHICVNKTSKQPYSGRDIPYLPPELERNLLMQADWVRRYFKLDAPILAADPDYLHEMRTEENVRITPRIYPLFRDPNRRDGHPLSRELLYAYFLELCIAVEDEITNGGSATMLFPLTEVVNGKRKLIFDIHCLRVTGITNMLKTGMPPDLVRDVVGHATIVMTLYYRHITTGDIHASLLEVYNQSLVRQAELRRLGNKEFLAEAKRSAEIDPLWEKLLPSSGSAWQPRFLTFSHGICPSGECSTGGEKVNGRHQAVPTLACSICRYRLTGAAFLAGLVANANTLLYRMKVEADELARLQSLVYDREDKGEDARQARAVMSSVRLRFEQAAIEWGAEITHIHRAVDNLGEGQRQGALVTGEAPAQLQVRLEKLNQFNLLQAIAAWSEISDNSSVVEIAAASQRDDLLGGLLEANGIDSFLMRLPRETRLHVANRLGEAVLKLVPDSELEPLLSGQLRLDHVVAQEACSDLRRIVAEFSVKARRIGSAPARALEGTVA